MSKILFKYLSKEKSLEKASVAHMSYIAIKNNIAFNNKNVCLLKDFIDTKYDYILGLNTFCAFNITNITEYITSVFNKKICLVLPTDIQFPMELIPFCLKVCRWSQDFIKTYLNSGYHNLASFLGSEYDNDKVLLCDKWSGLSYTTKVNNLISQNTTSAQKTIKIYNQKLGIIC